MAATTQAPGDQGSAKELGVEGIYDAFDMLAHDGQNFGKRLARDRVSVAEQYFKGDLAVEVHFRWHRSPGCNQFGYGLAVFYGNRDRLVGRDEWWPNPLKVLVDGGANTKAHLAFGVRGPYWNDQSMLVDPVEIVDCPQNFVPRLAVPSLVWLQLFDSLDSFVAGTREPDGNFSIGGFSVVVDRELCSLIGRVAIGNDQRPREMIERTPEIMDNVAKNGAELFGNFLPDSYFDDYLSGLKIILEDEVVRLSSDPGVLFAPEIGGVILRPLDFYSGASQSFSITVSHNGRPSGQKCRSRQSPAPPVVQSGGTFGWAKKMSCFATSFEARLVGAGCSDCCYP
jgi:hypothetical protein